MNLIINRPVNKLSDQAKLLNRSDQTKKIGLRKTIGQAQTWKKKL